MPDTLAQKVKKRFPGAYDHIPDRELEEQVIKRFPGAYDQEPRTALEAPAPVAGRGTRYGRPGAPAKGEAANLVEHAMSPFAPLSRGAQTVANVVEGVDRPIKDPGAFKLRGNVLAEEGSRTPVMDTIENLGWLAAGLSGVPSIVEAGMALPGAIKANIEHPVEANRAMAAGVIEGVGNMTPVDIATLLLGFRGRPRKSSSGSAVKGGGAPPAPVAGPDGKLRTVAPSEGVPDHFRGARMVHEKVPANPEDAITQIVAEAQRVKAERTKRRLDEDKISLPPADMPPQPTTLSRIPDPEAPSDMLRAGPHPEPAPLSREEAMISSMRQAMREAAERAADQAAVEAGEMPPMRKKAERVPTATRGERAESPLSTLTEDSTIREVTDAVNAVARKEPEVLAKRDPGLEAQAASMDAQPKGPNKKANKALVAETVKGSNTREGLTAAEVREMNRAGANLPPGVKAAIQSGHDLPDVGVGIAQDAIIYQKLFDKAANRAPRPTAKTGKPVKAGTPTARNKGTIVDPEAVTQAPAKKTGEPRLVATEPDPIRSLNLDELREMASSDHPGTAAIAAAELQRRLTPPGPKGANTAMRSEPVAPVVADPTLTKAARDKMATGGPLAKTEGGPARLDPDVVARMEEVTKPVLEPLKGGKPEMAAVKPANVEQVINSIPKSGNIEFDAAVSTLQALRRKAKMGLSDAELAAYESVAGDVRKHPDMPPELNKLWDDIGAANAARGPKFKPGDKVTVREPSAATSKPTEVVPPKKSKIDLRDEANADIKEGYDDIVKALRGKKMSGIPVDPQLVYGMGKMIKGLAKRGIVEVNAAWSEVEALVGEGAAKVRAAFDEAWKTSSAEATARMAMPPMPKEPTVKKAAGEVVGPGPEGVPVVRGETMSKASSKSTADLSSLSASEKVRYAMLEKQLPESVRAAVLNNEPFPKGLPMSAVDKGSEFKRLHAKTTGGEGVASRPSVIRDDRIKAGALERGKSETPSKNKLSPAQRRAAKGGDPPKVQAMAKSLSEAPPPRPDVAMIVKPKPDGSIRVTHNNREVPLDEVRAAIDESGKKLPSRLKKAIDEGTDWPAITREEWVGGLGDEVNRYTGWRDKLKDATAIAARAKEIDDLAAANIAAAARAEGTPVPKTESVSTRSEKVAKEIAVPRPEKAPMFSKMAIDRAIDESLSFDDQMKAVKASRSRMAQDLLRERAQARKRGTARDIENDQLGRGGDEPFTPYDPGPPTQADKMAEANLREYHRNRKASEMDEYWYDNAVDKYERLPEDKRGLFTDFIQKEQDRLVKKYDAMEATEHADFEGKPAPSKLPPAPKGVEPQMWRRVNAVEKTAKLINKAHGYLDPRLVDVMRRFWGSEEAGRRLGVDKDLVTEISGAPHKQRPFSAILKEADDRMKFMIEDPKGFARTEMLLAGSGAAAGALVGATLDGESAEDRFANMVSLALMGGLAGGATGRLGRGTPKQARLQFKSKGSKLKSVVEELDTANMLAGQAAIKASLGSVGGVAAGVWQRMQEGRVADAKRGMKFMWQEAPGMWINEFKRNPKSRAQKSAQVGSQIANVQKQAGGMSTFLLNQVLRPFVASDVVGQAALKRMGFSEAESMRMMMNGEPTSALGQTFLKGINSSFVLRMMAKFPRVRIGSLERGVEFTPILNKRVNTRTAHGAEKLTAAQLRARAQFGGAAMAIGTAYGYLQDPGPMEAGIGSAFAGPAYLPAAAAIAFGKGLKKAGLGRAILDTATEVSDAVPQISDVNLRSTFNVKEGEILPSRFQPGRPAKRLFGVE